MIATRAFSLCTTNLVCFLIRQFLGDSVVASHSYMGCRFFPPRNVIATMLFCTVLFFHTSQKRPLLPKKVAERESKSTLGRSETHLFSIFADSHPKRWPKG